MITVAISEITGINPVAGDLGLGDFPPVNDSDNFSFLVTLTATDPLTSEIIPITEISATCSYSTINITIMGPDSFKVSGIYSGIFNDQFIFRMKDQSIQTLPDYNPTAVGLFNWIFPTVRMVISDFNVTVTTDLGIENDVFTQYAYWNFEPHIVLFQQIIAKGM